MCLRGVLCFTTEDKSGSLRTFVTLRVLWGWRPFRGGRLVTEWCSMFLLEPLIQRFSRWIWELGSPRSTKTRAGVLWHQLLGWMVFSPDSLLSQIWRYQMIDLSTLNYWDNKRQNIWLRSRYYGLDSDGDRVVAAVLLVSDFKMSFELLHEATEIWIQLTEG